MNYTEMKNKVLALIRVLAFSNAPSLFDKFDKAVNHVMTEITRIKRVSDYVNVAVNKGNDIKFADEIYGEVYHVKKKDNGKHIVRGHNKVYEITDDETTEIDRANRPKRITPNRANNNYTFELSADILSIMPYGILANLLEGDKATIFATMYDNMLQNLDPRNTKNK